MVLKTVSNVVRLTINDDPGRVITFNPQDVGFVERFFTLMDNVEAKEAEYTARLEDIQQDKGENTFGVPNAVRKEIALTAEICAYMREQIDMVFGAGTSQTVFGDLNVPDMFGEFFAGIAPHISAARAKAVKKYTAPKDGVLK